MQPDRGENRANSRKEAPQTRYSKRLALLEVSFGQRCFKLPEEIFDQGLGNVNHRRKDREKKLSPKESCRDVFPGSFLLEICRGLGKLGRDMGYYVAP